jgi:hypothetical protein
MPCDQTHLLSPYLDGELSTADAEQVRQHLAACGACAAEADAHRAISRLMGMARRSSIGEPSEQVMDRLRLHVRGLVETTDYGLLRIARVFSGLAASILVAGLWLLTQPQQPAVNQTKTNGTTISIAEVDVLAELTPSPDPATQPVDPANQLLSPNAEPDTRDDVLQKLMGMPEASNSSLERELP